MKKLFGILFILLLSACNGEDQNTIVVGTIAGPETKLVEVAKKIAREHYHFNIKIVQFNDYTIPNIALNDGSLDANIFQHAPYLSQFITQHHMHLQSIGRTFIYPIGLYSHKYKTMTDIPDNATIAIPNDPSNGARALLLLDNAKLITLSNKTPLTTLNDIKSNPKQFQFKEIDAAQLPRALHDVDAAVINTTYAMLGNLLPSRDAIFLEDKHSPYANLIVVRKDDNNPLLKLLVKVVQSNTVKKEANKLFKGQAIQAW